VLFKLPAIAPRSPPLTADERVHTRNEEPTEVFTSSNRRLFRVSVHSQRAKTPLHLTQHEKRVSNPGGSLAGPLTTWDGLMDDALTVRFVPKKVAKMYTATNAMTPKFLAGFAARRRVQTARSVKGKQQKPDWIANFNSKVHTTDRKHAVSADEEHSRRQAGKRRLPLTPELVQLRSQVERALLVGRSIEPQQVLLLMLVSV